MYAPYSTGKNFCQFMCLGDSRIKVMGLINSDFKREPESCFLSVAQILFHPGEVLYQFFVIVVFFPSLFFLLFWPYRIPG